MIPLTTRYDECISRPKWVKKKQFELLPLSSSLLDFLSKIALNIFFSVKIIIEIEKPKKI